MGNLLNILCASGIHFTIDGFRLLHGLLATFLWLAAMIFSTEYMEREKNKTRFYLFSVFTYLATMGIFFASDLFSIFIFFEIMSFTSFVWVAQDEKKESLKAASTYLAIAVTGGLVMLMGIFMLYSNYGSPLVAGVCLMIGFGAKAGIFGLHVWMGDSYSAAPAPASALLSGILSKTGLYGILVVTVSLFMGNINWGYFVVVMGLLTMSCGAVLALFSVQLKRTLAFSSMSQIGFMVTGIGMMALMGSEGTIAARGTVLHMLNHSLIKLVLFLIAGIIYRNVGKLDLNDIRGYGRRKPLLKFTFLTAALGIGGIPLFNGYVSKTLLHEGIVEGIQAGIFSGTFLHIAEWIFLTCGGFTIAYMAKLFIAIFMETNNADAVQVIYDGQKTYVGKHTAVMLTLTSAIMLLIGILPGFFADRMADICEGFLGVRGLAYGIRYFSLHNLTGAVISIVLGIGLYILAVRICMMKKENGQLIYADCWPEWMNLEKTVYKPLCLKVLPAIAGFFCRICDSFPDLFIVILRKTVFRDSKLPHELEEGSVVSYTLGNVWNAVVWGMNHTFWRKHPDYEDYVHAFAVKEEEWVEDKYIIARSLSFGLLLFCVGLCTTLLYVLLE